MWHFTNKHQIASIYSETDDSLTEQKVTMQDSLIKAYIVKNQTYAQQIILYKEKEKKYIDYTKTLKTDVKKAKFKNHLASGAGMLVVLGLILTVFVSN